MTTHRLPGRKESIWVSQEPCNFVCRSWNWQSFPQIAPTQNHQFYRSTHFYLLCGRRCFIVWGRDVQFCSCEWPILPSVSGWRCWGLTIMKRLCWLVCFECCRDCPCRSIPLPRSTSLPLNIALTTLKCFVEFDDVGVLQWGHGVDLLYKSFLELRIFDHFLFGEALDGVVGWWGGGFGGE